MKNVLECKEMMTIQEEIYQIICIIKIVVNTLVEIYQDEQYEQQSNFIGKLKEDDGAIVFFIAEKQQKIILNFSLD